MLYNNALELIGNTPVVRLNNLGCTNGCSNIYVKLEKVNPAGSIKDRAVYEMLEGLEQRGELKKGDVLVEATSGNTGIALSMIGKLKGYEVVIVMPETMVLTDGKAGMAGSIEKANELLKENPNYKSLKQFENKDNPNAHYKTTAVEIMNDVKDLDIFVCGVGTGGTLIGTARYLKEQNPNIRVIALEPKKSPAISENKTGPHKIQGIGANFVPENYDSSVVDEVILVDDEDAFDTVKLLAAKEGILVGISSGANIFGAIEMAKKYPDKKIVTVAPDGVDKYMSMGIF